MGQPDGPFTRIHDVKEEEFNGVCGGVAINDLGMSYNKLYFEDKGTSLIDYDAGSNPNCDSRGFSTSYMSLRLNSTYYYFNPILTAFPWLDHAGESPGMGIPRDQIYETTDVKSGGMSCNVCDNIELNDICFSKFKLHMPDEDLHINKITDIETENNNCGNNKYIYDFYLYVASCHSNCLTCLGVSQCLTCYSALPKLCPTVDGGSSGACTSTCNLCTIIGENTYEVIAEEKCYSKS